jgi:hypothetical protein
LPHPYHLIHNNKQSVLVEQPDGGVSIPHAEDEVEFRVVEQRGERDEADELLVAVPLDGLLIEVHRHADHRLLVVFDIRSDGYGVATRINHSPEGESHEVLAVDVGLAAL